MNNNKSNPAKSKTLQDRVEFADDCKDSVNDATSTSKTKSKNKSK